MNIGITLTVDECIRKVNEATLKFFGFLKHFEKDLIVLLIDVLDQLSCLELCLLDLLEPDLEGIDLLLKVAHLFKEDPVLCGELLLVPLEFL